MSSHPFAAPTVNGDGSISVARYLKEPTRITRMVEDLTLGKFLSDYLFSAGPKPSGGAIVYDEAVAPDEATKYLQNGQDVLEIAPSGQFPRFETADAETAKVAKVAKYGGEVEIAWEAKTRNDTRAFARDITRLANTIVKKINTRAIDTLDAALVANPTQATSIGALGLTGWATIAAQSGGIQTGMGTTFAVTKTPDALFDAVQLQADTQDMGVEYDTLLAHPVQCAQLKTIYQKDLAGILSAAGLTLVKTTRVPNGTLYFAQAGQVGGIGLEQPLATRTYTEDRHQRDVVQSSVIPVFYVDNPTAVLKVTGVNA